MRHGGGAQKFATWSGPGATATNTTAGGSYAARRVGFDCLPPSRTAVPVAFPAPVVTAFAAASPGSGAHVALGLRQQRPAGQADLAVPVDVDDLDHHEIADVEHVLDLLRAAPVDLGHVQQAVTPRPDLHDRP